MKTFTPELIYALTELRKTLEHAQRNTPDKPNTAIKARCRTLLKDPRFLLAPYAHSVLHSILYPRLSIVPLTRALELFDGVNAGELEVTIKEVAPHG